MTMTIISLWLTWSQLINISNQWHVVSRKDAEYQVHVVW